MILAVLASLALIVMVLVESFEAMILPRRVTRPYRFNRFYYRNTWKLWRAIALWMKPGKRRETFLSWFGPLSLLLLIVLWFIGLIVGFGSLDWSLGLSISGSENPGGLGTYLYYSGVTFFTLGLGDVTPHDGIARFLTVVEAGTGFGFLALIISYLPVLYQAFSKRELAISLLDARGGSPPTACEVLRRAARGNDCSAMNAFLAEWEHWCAEVLESHLSFPVLSFYRSQHDNQSWLGALTAVLDTCALLLAVVKEVNPYQTQMTFAMARHTVVDVALVFHVPPDDPATERLSEEERRLLWKRLEEAGLALRDGPASEARLLELRKMYEPFVIGLARYFQVQLPPIVSERVAVDNWQTSAWTRRTPGIGKLSGIGPADEHFD